MLACSDEVAYIHEPFNLYNRPGVCNISFDYWFPYVKKANEEKYLDGVSRCLNYNYSLMSELGALSSMEDFVKMFYDGSRFLYYRIIDSRRPLIKDPIALFSLQWLADTFDMDVLLLIRHPAAFAGSLKKIGWSHPFSHFLKQPLLMQDHLSSYRQEIEAFAGEERPIVEQSVLLWNMIHGMILHYREKNPEWIYVRHEDISIDPLTSFEKLYKRLGLHFSQAARKKIEKHSLLKSGKTPQKKLVRDSKANIKSWQKRLTDDEIALVREGTAEIAREFYSDSDWI